MKNFLRKLHIGEGSGDGASSPPPPPSREGGTRGGEVEERVIRESSEVEERKREREEEDDLEAFHLQLVLKMSAREVEKRVIRESSEAEERKREREKEENDLEAYQILLVLERSVRDNPEEMEIEVAKQLSLGFCPPQRSPAEVLAVRYWNFNALGYDDKISDGFYDLFYVGNGSASVTMPSFAELRAQPFSHQVDWEVVLVHRGEDPELMKLQQEALIMTLELQSRTSESVGNALVKKLANLVARHMGGVFDPESMSVKYQNMLCYLRSGIGSVIVPLGQLKIGLARHRALLFKVLADGLDVPCRLLKGKQYTGSDDGGLNIVKFKDGREFIVDFVADSCTLIPSDVTVLSTELDRNFVSDNHHFGKDDTTNLLGSSLSGVSSSTYGSFEYGLLDRRSTSSNVGPSDALGRANGCQKLIRDRPSASALSPTPLPPIPIDAEVPTSSSSPSSVGVGAEDREGRQSGTVERRRSLQQADRERRRSQETLRELRRSREEEMGRERERGRSQEQEEDDLDAYQIQPALAISAQDNQVEMDFCPPQRSPAEVLAEIHRIDHSSSGLPRDIPFHLLEQITDGFSNERKLGSGAFGKVYMGVHNNGEKIAVKMLHGMPALEEAQFLNEFNSLASLQHPNIVRLVGYCYEIQNKCVEYNGKLIFAERIFRALCFEYMHHGSLDKHLSDEYHGLDWNTRYAIIKGICNGLKYLHDELKPPIYHLDLKPANILLDANRMPKICDFGLSRFFGEEPTQITRSYIGTHGYIPPEYIEKNIISNKFDIFSLGVVIIKIMMGPTGYIKSAEMSSKEFVELVHKNWTDRLHATIPMHFLELYSKQVKRCVEVALNCVEVDRHIRPSVGDIVKILNETDYDS